MEDLGLTGIALLIAATVGITELVKRAFKLEWFVVTVIAVAGATGWILGPAAEVGVTSLQGMVIGFGASGVIKGLSYLKRDEQPPELG